MDVVGVESKGIVGVVVERGGVWLGDVGVMVNRGQNLGMLLVW